MNDMEMLFSDTEWSMCLRRYRSSMQVTENLGDGAVRSIFRNGLFDDEYIFARLK